MSKKHFIALADAIRSHNLFAMSDHNPIFGPAHLDLLADFCQSSNPKFDRLRWLGYIAGTNGKNGGKRSESTVQSYREAAKRIHESEGTLEIDSNAVVSVSDDGGAYVQAWVWVYDSEV